MTIYTSNLPNDQDLIRALGSIAVPIPLYTDVAFSGAPTDTEPAPVVAIERKKIGDLADCIISGRLIAQLTRCKSAGADVLLVIIEGRTRRSLDDGLLEVPVWGINPRTGRRAEIWQPVLPSTSYSRFCQYLFELSYLAGVFVLRTENVRETADTIQALYVNFGVAPGDHQSLKQIFRAPPPVVQLTKPSLVRRVASDLPGIGWERSGAVARRFRSVAEMATAGEKDWLAIPGIGKVLSRKIVAELNGNTKSGNTKKGE